MSELSSDEDINLSPAELAQVVHNDELRFLPEKSREKYVKAYDLFNAWRHSKGAETISENVMLSYFVELAETRKCSTLWSIFSMLKATIKTKNCIHIEKFSKLLTFLKQKSSGHIPKTSKIFTSTNIEQFLNEAPDYEFLAAKVVLIIGISGACRSHELTYLTTKNVEKHSEKLLVVNLSNTNTNIHRNFVIRNEYVKIIEKYQALRPAHTHIDRFFLQYRKGKCTAQPMGSNNIGVLPRKIATFLGLQDPEQYTGHCFRRTSATLLADSGADLTTLKRQGRRKSITLAEEYVEDSIENKSKICKCIIGDSKGSYNKSTNNGCPLDEDSSQSAQAGHNKYLHAGLVCKICAKEIRGFRYTCVQCAEFDMCSACEALQAHAAHYVLRVPAHRPLWEVSEMLERVRAQVDVIQPEDFQEPEIYKPEIKIEFEPDPLKEEPCSRPHSSNMLEQSLVSLELFEVKEEPLCAESERADDAPTTSDLEEAPAGQLPPAPAPRVAKRKLPPAASQKQEGQTKKIANETKQDITLLNQLPSTSQVEQTPTAHTDDQHLSRVADDSGGAFQFDVYSHNTAAPATQTQTHAHTQNVIHSTTAKEKGV